MNGVLKLSPYYMYLINRVPHDILSLNGYYMMRKGIIHIML